MADRYWVGGTGTWDTTTTTHWSATSGGAAGASAPATTDNAFFDSNSGSNYIVTITTGTCTDFTATGTVTFAGSANFVTRGNFFVGSGVTWTSTGALTFSSAVTGKTITTNGVTFPTSFTFNNPGGGYQLQDDLTSSSTTSLLNCKGSVASAVTLDLNGFVLTVGTANMSGAAQTALAFGTTGAINITGSNATVWACGIATGFTLTGTPTVNFTYNGSVGTRTIQQGSAIAGTAAQTFSFNIVAGSDIIALSTQAVDLNFTGFTGTFTNLTRSIYGNLTLGTGMTLSGGSSVTTFAATSGTKTITSNGVSILSPIAFNGVGGTWQLQDALTVTNGVTTTLTAGTFDMNSQVFTTSAFNSTGATTRTLAFGTTGQMIVTGSGATVFTIQVDTNLTCSGSKNVYFTYSGGTGTRTITTNPSTTIATNSLNYYVQAGTDIVTFGGASGIVVRNLDFTGFSGTMTTNVVRAYGNVTLSPTMTLTAVASTYNFQGPSGGTQTFTSAGLNLPVGIVVNAAGGTVVFADDITALTTATLTLTTGTLNLNNRTVSIGRFSANGTLARALAFGTTSVLNITGDNATVWGASNATNFSYTGVGRVNFTYSGSAGTRGIQHGTTGGGTAATKPPPMYVTGGSDILDPKIAGTWYSDLDYTGYTGNVANWATNFAGNLILGTGMLVSAGANAYTFLGNTSTQAITTNGVVTDFPIIISGSGTTFQLSEPLVLGNTRALTVNGGNLNANGYNITTGTFVCSNGNPRTVNISNTTVTLNGTGTVWNTTATTGLTFISANSSIIMNENTSASKFLNLGNITCDNLVIGGNTSTATSFIYGNGVTIGTLSSTRTVNQSLLFSANNTYTINNWNVVGTSSARVSVSSDGATPFNLIYGGTGNVNVSYHTISFSNASPSNTWYALFTNNNSNGGDNTGWIFTLPPAATSSNFFLMF